MNIISFQYYFLNPHAMPLLIIGLLILSSGIFVFMNLKDRLTASTFLVMSISGRIWFLGTMMGYLSKDPNIGLLWFKIDNVGVAFLSSTVYAFITSFLKLHKKRIIPVFLAYMGSSLVAILTLTTNWMVTGVQSFFWGFFPKWGVLSLIFLPFFFFYMLLSFLELILYLFYGKDQTIKKQILFFVLAFGFAYTSSIDYFATYGIPVYPTSFISMGAYFVIITYAITKTRLMDISVIISKSFAYGATIVLLCLLYFVFAVPYKSFVSPNIDAGFLSMTLAYSIFVGFAFERLRMFIQTSSDKVFLKGKYELKNALPYFVGKLFKIVSLEQLRQLFDNARTEIIESKILSLFIVGKEDNSVSLPNELVDYLQSNISEIAFVADLGNKASLLRGVANIKDIEFFVGCFSQDKLVAIVIVGKKLSEDPFRDEEVETFKILSPQIAAVIERISPYEKARADYVVAQKEAEDAKLTAERAQQMALLGRLYLQAGHEIKNPIAMLMMHSELLKGHVGDAEHIQKYIELVERQVARVEDIVDKMKEFGSEKKPEKTPVNINDIIDRQALFLLEGLIKKKMIKVEKDFRALPLIPGNPSALEAAFVNIILNALEAMGDKGTLTIKTADLRDRVEIRISDTGCGIPQDDLKNIFMPMFTTKHDGTGLGLTITYKTIVSNHGGEVMPKSEIGKGTEFVITLPIREA